VSQQVIAGGGNQAELSRKAVIDAGADARQLMQDSKVIASLVSVDIIARQLFLLIRGGLENEITHGWEVENPDLVIQTLGLSAQEKAVSDPIKATELREALLTTVLPVVDIFCQMEAQHAAAEPSTDTSAPVPGTDDQPPGGLAEVPGGAESHAEQQA
jgi:hypothetical protein